MSPISMPKSLSTFLTQENLEKTLYTLRQPAAVGVIASLGIHGLGLLSLPVLTQASKPDDAQQKTVQVVELSPAEQLRLPQTASPQITFPPPSIQSQAPTTSGNNLPDPSLFNNSSGLGNIPSFPPPPEVWNPPLFDPSVFFGGNSRPGNREATGSKKTAANSAKPAKKEPKEETPEDKQETPATSETPKPDPTTSPSPEPTAPARSEKLTQEQLAALLAQARQNAANRESYTLNAGVVNVDIGKKNGDDFLAEARELTQGKLKDDGWQRGKEVTGFYPESACLFQVSGSTWIGALVKPDGQVERSKVLLSSGYKGLDKAALDYVAGQKFDATENYQLFTIPFKFEYSKAACPPKAPTPPPA